MTDQPRADATTCEQRIWRGPREGEVCGRRAVFLVEAAIDIGLTVCAIHAKAYTRPALVRLARWSEKEQGWM
jgi:hypothetical protein